MHEAVILEAVKLKSMSEVQNTADKAKLGVENSKLENCEYQEVLNVSLASL